MPDVLVRRNWQREKTHCPQGHEYNKTNILYTKEHFRKCRKCEKNVKKLYHIKNREQLIKKSREWVINNKQRAKETKHIIYLRKKEEISTTSKIRTRKARYKLMNILGGEKCNYCGIDIFEVLHFDHINGGGTKERRLLGNGRDLYEYYIKRPDLAKEKLQVLCANCNWIKKTLEAISNK